MIKNFLGNAEIGFYSAALVCATMTSFVFNAIIDSFRPLILEKKMKKDPSYEKNLSALYGIVFYLAVAQAIFVTVFASWIVKILYGNLYEVSAAVLQIAIWFTVFSYMGGVRTIWILAEKKQKYLWILNLSGFLINVLLNLFFIPVWGICGAAVASCITQFFTNFLIGYFLRPLASNNILILRGISPIFLKDAIKGLKK
jgi:O-antigen/teichoic acid export membrane protein